MAKAEDLAGRRFNMMTVLCRSDKVHNTVNRGAYWLCRCDCGKEKIISAKVLKAGHIVSCGCHRRTENSVKRNPLVKSLYSVYNGMKQRCYNENCFSYQWYGARGITICDEWLGDGGFRNFEQWAYDSGYKKGLTIDRINTYGNYEPSNCRWTSMKVQQNNKTTTKYATYKGVTLPLAYWAEYLGISYETLYFRLTNGWSVKRAFETKVENKQYTFNGETHSLSEWAKITGLKEETIRMRIFKKWSIERTLTTPYKEKQSDETICINGVTHTIKEWSEITKIPRSTIYSRLRAGKTVKEIFKESEVKDSE